MILFGATALPGRATDETVAAFGPVLKYMRDFGRDGPDDDRLPELPPHGAGKWLQKPAGCVLHVSWKDDVEELATWLDGLAEDIWLTVWHEPHGDVDPAQYRTTGAQAAQIIAAHPNGHHVVRLGPVVTRYWLVSKGGDPLDWWFPGANLYGVDVYNDSKQAYRDSEDLFGAALAKVRTALPGVEICIPEFGLALIPPDDGTERARKLREHATYLRAQGDVIACAEWDIGGCRITGREPEESAWRTILEEQTVAQSPEFPQYRWMPPRSWTNASRTWPDDIRWIVIHTTEGSEGPQSAEDGASYDQRRTDGTSAHFYVDSNSVVQCVRTADIAHTAMAAGNRRGIHIEVCGRAGQSAAQWDDPVSRATIAQLAGLCRVLRVRYPVPLVNLTPAQVRAGAVGFCEHLDISRAFGESDHTDPGPRFPWARLFQLIEEDDVNLADTVYSRTNPDGTKSRRTVGNILGSLDVLALRAEGRLVALQAGEQQIRETLAGIVADPGNPVQLSPEQVGELAGLLAARLPAPPTADEVADAVVAEIAS